MDSIGNNPPFLRNLKHQKEECFYLDGFLNNISFPKHKKRVPKSVVKDFLGEKIMTMGRVAFINSPFYHDINGTIPLLKLFQKDLKKAKRNALITTKPNKIMAAWTMMFLEKNQK